MNLRSELHDTRGALFCATSDASDQENSDFKIPCSWPVDMDVSLNGGTPKTPKTPKNDHF